MYIVWTVVEITRPVLGIIPIRSAKIKKMDPFTIWPGTGYVFVVLRNVIKGKQYALSGFARDQRRVSVNRYYIPVILICCTTPGFSMDECRYGEVFVTVVNITRFPRKSDEDCLTTFPAEKMKTGLTSSDLITFWKSSEIGLRVRMVKV